jgi:hypothetical protein
MQLRISKPDDSNEYYYTNITSTTYEFPGEFRVSFIRSEKDPIQAGLETFWKSALSIRGGGNRTYAYNRRRNTINFGEVFNHVVMIGGCPVVLSRKGIRYHLNGKSYSLSTIASALARVTFKSCFEKDPAKLLSGLYATLQLPENVKYCMENRAPYHFHEDYERIDVRLNVVQIDDKMLAMEISDGVWGEITPQQLDTYCNFYIHGQSRGKWKRLAPATLYKRLMGRSPTDSELKLMVAFLQQNRMQDIVDKRAIELVDDMLKQYKGRLSAVHDDDGTLLELHIRGKDYDWKLTNNKFKSGIQMVSTFIWQPVEERKQHENEETGEVTYNKVLSEPNWRGPICIDNMSDGSPLGDQFAGRALALLNDSMTIKIVNTIKSYLAAEPNEYRVDNNDLR